MIASGGADVCQSSSAPAWNVLMIENDRRQAVAA
jgi:hypothetical protein